MKKLRDSFKTAIISLKVNRMRSFLTILGIVIGISSVITVMSLGEGAQNLILEQIMALGPANVYIEPGSIDIQRLAEGRENQDRDRGQIATQIMEGMNVKTLTLKDLEAIEKDPLVEAVAPIVTTVNRVVYENINKRATILGTTPEYNQIADVEIVLGSDFTDFDVQSRAKVAVLGHKISEDLFQEEDPLGKTIRIKETNFKVIGVMEEQGSQSFLNFDEYIYVPVTTAQEFLLGINYVQSSIAKIVSQDKVDEAMESIRLLLRERHNIYNPEGDLSKDDFSVVSGKETAEMMATVTNILTALLSSIASIALVVGGIGIMNIMLVSVVERTKEIGLRKAVGARKKDILYQFLMEAVVLTALGGIAGILVGMASSYLLSIIMSSNLGIQWHYFISFRSIILGLIVATGIGIIFGIYPARRAAELSPIEALRYE
ncbi:MAG: ABC transporter permease [Candidatus Pacebacteria bacterium]|nr:ABC transporter permease [Candidatus Paceibacterota bacterium]